MKVIDYIILPIMLREHKKHILKEFLKFLLSEVYYERYMERVYGAKNKIKAKKIIERLSFFEEERYVDGLFIWEFDEVEEWSNCDNKWRAWLLNNDF